MRVIQTVGLDVAKTVFQVHGVDAKGRVTLRRKPRRGEVLALFAGLEPCLVGIEACASAHHWARAIATHGHEVRLMPPQYVKPYVKRHKNDAADAEAICEAVTRPTMRFVPVKSPAQQGVLTLHRTRDLLVRQRTMLVNALRGHLAEFGVVVPQGIENLAKLARAVADPTADHVPDHARQALGVIAAQVADLQGRIRELERAIVRRHRDDGLSRRLATIPGIGPLTASAITATVAEPRHFRSGRQFAAWLGLVPRQHSTGGKTRLGGISKRGDAYIRRLLFMGAHGVIRSARLGRAAGTWLHALLARRPAKVAAVAIANKLARVAWALMARGGTYAGIAPAVA